MRIGIGVDERYLFFYTSADSCEDVYKVDARIVKRWKWIEKEFEEMQSEMEAIIEKASESS